MFCVGGKKTDVLLTNVFAVHVEEETEAVCRGVGDAIWVLGHHVEEGTDQPRHLTLLPRPGRLDVHVETCSAKCQRLLPGVVYIGVLYTVRLM